PLVPSALQRQRKPGSLPGDPSPAGTRGLRRARREPGCRPDRVSERGPVGPPEVRGRAGQARPEVSDAGRGVPGPELRGGIRVVGNADQSPERTLHAGRPGNADGRATAPLLDAVCDGETARRAPHAGHLTPWRAPGGLQGSVGEVWLDPGVLPPSQREPALG